MARKVSDVEVLQESAMFSQHFSVVFLATVDEAGCAQASHAPFVQNEHGIYIYVSLLAKHTRNLNHNPRASLLFLEDVADSANVFALKRLQLNCDALFVDLTDSEWISTMDQFKEKFGVFINTLNSLGDFHLIKFKPCSGKYVRGFAQTYELSGSDLDQLQHVNPGKA